MKDKDFVDVVTYGLIEGGYGRRSAILKSWKILRLVRDASDPITEVLSSIGVCEECLRTGWIERWENGETCLKCGTEYLILEDE